MIAHITAWGKAVKSASRLQHQVDRNIIRAVVRSAILYRLWSKNAKGGYSETISRHIYKGGMCNPVSSYHQSVVNGQIPCMAIRVRSVNLNYFIINSINFT